jgi:hypothetical protein
MRHFAFLADEFIKSMETMLARKQRLSNRHLAQMMLLFYMGIRMEIKLQHARVMPIGAASSAAFLCGRRDDRGRNRRNGPAALDLSEPWR